MSKKKQVRKLKPEENKVVATIPDAQPIEVTPMVMMQMAINEGSDIATMERLWALNEKVEAANAKKAYDFAMAKFKADPPTIEKDRHVEFGNTVYDHASLGNVVEKIGARMGEYELSHKWDIDQGEKIKVTCVVTHSQGHSESVSLESAADTSGSIKGIQAIASAISYLQRYTLLAVTGLATQDMDDDGRGSEVVDNIELITEDQSNEIHAKIDEHNLNKQRFIDWMKADFGCETFADIPANYFERVNKRIDSAIRAQELENHE